MSFFTNVQRGKISSPVHKSYSDVAWKAAYAETRESVDCDRIYHAGKIVFRLLESLRSANSLLPKWCDTEKHIRYLIGLCNRDTIVISNMMHDKFDEVINPFLNDLEHFKVPLSTGQMVKPDELSTSSVDSLTTVILDVQSTSEIKIANGLTDLAKLHCLASQLNLCNTYQWIESIWRECLWNGYEFVDDGASGYYIEAHSDTARAIAIATSATLYRRKIFQHNLVGVLSEIWRNQLSDTVKSKFSSTEFVTAIVGSGKAKSVVFSSNKHSELEDRARFEAFVAKELIRQDFYQDILSNPVPKLGGENVEKLFDVWLVLRSLSRASANRLTDASVLSPNTLLTFAPSFSRKQIVEIVVRATKFSIKIVDKLLDFLVFRKRGHTLWTQPLLETTDKKIILFFSALHQSEPLYVLERWLPMLSINIGAKGNPFEKEVRKSLKIAEKSSLIKNIFFDF